MDNTTILFNAVQRTYRNALVNLIRERLSDKYGPSGIQEVKKPFAKKNRETGKTYWETIKDAAHERRSGGTGELSTPVRDEFEVLGVEHFFSVFDAHFEVLCPNHAHKPKKERNQARQTLTTWMKQIKNVRDPVSHPVADDINYEESAQVLFCARKTLDFCGLPDASAQILRIQRTLLGGFTSDAEKILTVLPPEDEVVMDFIGRHRELAALNDWLGNSTSRRWALSGEGGTGKSAIAYAFSRSVSGRNDHGLEAVLWMSAKRRRFLEGATVLVDRPDFHNKESSVHAILEFFGESAPGDEAEARALELLADFPSLIVVDDIDTVDVEGEDAIQFLLMTVPEHTKSRVLLTSRRALFGMGNLTTQVQGMSPDDAENFIKSRCSLMGVGAPPVLAAKERLLEVTDSFPLFIEDLLRLAQTGIGIEKAIGLWAEKRGVEARKYAIQREYDQLDEDAKQVLLALTLQGPCRANELCRGLDWQDDRLVDALQQLRMMFLLPGQKSSGSAEVLALNRNMQTLVREVFNGTEAFRRTERLMKAASGRLRPKRSEDQQVLAILRRAGLLVRQWREAEAEAEVQAALGKFPGRGDILGTLAWIQKKNKDSASARMNFKRAHELGCSQVDTYWHWSDMEASHEEWNASADAAKLGIARCGKEQGLLFRLGYALHRQGRELIREGEDGTKLCQRAKEMLEDARKLRDSEARNHSLQHQIYRAIALNLEALDDGQLLARHFAQWQSECPDDTRREGEYQRLRKKYPEYLCAH